VNVSGEVAIESANDTVKIEGAGTLTGVNGTLVMRDLIVASESDIQAVGLRVIERLDLLGNAVLRAKPGGTIDLTPDILMVFQGEGQKLPTLDLGVVGEGYGVMPSEIRVDIDAGAFSENDQRVLEHALVIAETFSNCEAWKHRAWLDTGPPFELTCDHAVGAHAGLPVIALVLRGAGFDESELDTHFLGLSVGAWVTIVTGIVSLILVKHMVTLARRKNSPGIVHVVPVAAIPLVPPEHPGHRHPSPPPFY
jgi:hypothetical protein